MVPGISRKEFQWIFGFMINVREHQSTSENKDRAATYAWQAQV
jgi:hypothetical protein